MYSAQTGRRIRRYGSFAAHETGASLEATKSCTHQQDKTATGLRRTSSAPSIGRSREIKEGIDGLATSSFLETSDLLKVKEAQFSTRPSSAHVRLSAKERLAPYIKTPKTKTLSIFASKPKTCTPRNNNGCITHRTEMSTTRPGTPIVSSKEPSNRTTRSNIIERSAGSNTSHLTSLRLNSRPKTKKKIPVKSMESFKERDSVKEVNILTLDESRGDPETSIGFTYRAGAFERPTTQPIVSAQHQEPWDESQRSKLNLPSSQENQRNNNKNEASDLGVEQSAGICRMQLMGKVSDLMDMLGIDHDWMVSTLIDSSQ